MGESMTVAALAAVNILTNGPFVPIFAPCAHRPSGRCGNDEGKPLAALQLSGRSSVTVVGSRSAPRRYMKACGPPISPPVGVRNGRHDARGKGAGGGSAMR